MISYGSTRFIDVIENISDLLEVELPPEIEIPSWVKQNAGWWSDGAIADSDFVSGIQYLITKGIMTI